MPYARHQDYRKIIDRKVPPGTRIFNGTWVSGKSFQINTDDPFVKELHSIQRLPFLIEKKTFGIILLVIFIANALFNISYELIIPFFENTMNENSSEFKTIDDLVFYSQFIAAGIFILIYIISLIKSASVKRSWAEKTVAHYSELLTQNRELLREIAGKYLLTCPNCGAPNDGDVKICEYCGSEMRAELTS